MHYCHVSDPIGKVGCICTTGRDHNEDEVDLAPGVPTFREAREVPPPPPPPLSSSLPAADREPLDNWQQGKEEDRYIENVQGKWSDDVG